MSSRFRDVDHDHQRRAISCQPSGAVGLRQVDGPEADCRADLGAQRRPARMVQARPWARPMHRLCLSGADADALGDACYDNVWLPLRLQRRVAAECGARPGRGEMLEQRPPLTGFRGGGAARTVGRHEDAHLDRPRAGDAAARPVDGRTVRGARRDHPQPVSTTTFSSICAGKGALHGDLRHPFSVFESVYPGKPDRGDGRAIRAGCSTARWRSTQPYPRRRRLSARPPGYAAL